MLGADPVPENCRRRILSPTAPVSGFIGESIRLLQYGDKALLARILGPTAFGQRASGSPLAAIDGFSRVVGVVNAPDPKNRQ
jgi:hypothetical protein